MVVWISTWRSADVVESVYKAVKRERGSSSSGWTLICVLSSGKTACVSCLCLVTAHKEHFNGFLSLMFTYLPVCMTTCVCLTLFKSLTLYPSGPPAAAELRESSAGGPALQRGLPTGSDWTNRAAEDWNSAAAVAPTTLGQSGSLL